MSEPYRAVLGHLPHDVGHYYQLVLTDAAARARFVELFGDPDENHQAASGRGLSPSVPPGWEQDYVSTAAATHPAEDFAETFAHYLHIRDTLDTAASFAMAPAGSSPESVMSGDMGFEQLLEWWLPLSWALNQINRSMGHPDLYPYLLPDRVLDKIRFVHNLVSPG